MPDSDMPSGRPVRAMLRLLSADQWFWLMVSLVIGARLLFLATNQLGLAADEMHYWDWSRQPDLAYYSKGPMVAWLIGLSTGVFGVSPLAIRLPAVVLGAALIVLLFRHARDRLGPQPALAIAVFAQLLPIVGGLGVAMTTDPPMLLCWLVSLLALETALRHRRPWGWGVYGLAVALGLLTKATMLLLPVGLVVLAALLPVCRPLLVRPGFWIAQLGGLMGLLPLLIWNSRHAWVNWSHNLGHLGVGRANPALVELPWRIAELMAGQWLLFGLVTAPLLLAAAGLAFRHGWRHRDPYPVLLGGVGLLLLSVCLAVALRRSVYPNWPLPLGLIGLLLAVEAWPLLRPYRRWWRLGLCGSALNGLVLLLAHLPFFGITLGLTHRQLPTRRLLGWRELSGALQQQHPSLLAAAPLILTERYTTASALAYGLLRPSGSVLTVALGRGRMNQYDLWAQAEMPRRIGQNALIVLDVDTDPAALYPLFERLRPLPPLRVHSDGHLWRVYQVWSGESYTGQSLPQPSRF